jgi:protein gp37
MAATNIEWTEITWNPTTGCNKVSSGCKFCYAERLAEQLQNENVRKYANGFNLTMHDYELKRPYKWNEPQLVFVNSMSDLFHQDVPLEFLKRVFKVMNETRQHTYQILTKRDSRLLQLNDQLNWTKNIWMGVSVEDERVVSRIDSLRKTDAAVKFLSCEPLIGPLINLNLKSIDWVIVGGESGLTPRPMAEEWVQDIRLQCKRAGVKFFFKQWGGRNKKAAGRLLNGRTYDEMPGG